jgi:phage tail protein X
MKFVTIKTETSLADLTRDVFEIKGTKAASAAKTAQAALREANPHVADLKKVPSGTLVVVPDVPGIKTAPAQSIEGVSVGMMRQLKSALAAAKAVVEKSTAAQAEDAEASASLAKNRDLVALAKQTPELKQRLSQVVDRAKTQAKQIADDKKAQIEGLTQLEKDLATLSSG